MFDLGWAEMGVVMLVALVGVGRKELPRRARDIGRWAGKARAMAREFQRSLEDMAREAELDDVKKQIEQVGRFDARREIERTIDPDGSLKRALDAETPAAKPNGGTPPPALDAAASPPAAEGPTPTPARADPH